MKPTPISIHESQYEKNGTMSHRLEFWYFVRTELKEIKINTEVAEAKRFDISQILSLSTNNEIFQCTKDVLEQNEDLLELL